MFFKNRTNPVTPNQVLDVLRTVSDPDLHKNIVELGFVKNLKIENGEVCFDLELTTPACPVKEELKAECERKIQAIEGVKSVHLHLTSNVRSTVQGSGKASLPGVRNVIAVASGKGGVGKSTVTINLAMALAKTGARVGLLDADIYGPSIPMMMGATDRPKNLPDGRVEPVRKDGIPMMSMGFLVPPQQAMVWRGPMVHGALVQFLNQVQWGELDYLLIDMPPGTGDAQLTICQTAPLSGAVIVTTPQDISLLDARRGMLMFQNVKVPILGVVENMSGFACEHCGHTTAIFLEGGGERISREMGVPLLGAIPLDPKVAEGGDKGTPVVLKYPDSPVAKAYNEMAGQMAAELSIIQAQGDGQFTPLRLEWKA